MSRKTIEQVVATLKSQYGDSEYQPPKALMDRPLETTFPALAPEKPSPVELSGLTQLPQAFSGLLGGGQGQMQGLQGLMQQQMPMAGMMQGMGNDALAQKGVPQGMGQAPMMDQPDGSMVNQTMNRAPLKPDDETVG